MPGQIRPDDPNLTWQGAISLQHTDDWTKLKHQHDRLIWRSSSVQACLYNQSYVRQIT